MQPIANQLNGYGLTTNNGLSDYLPMQPAVNSPNGYGAMIERMNNLEQRTVTPQKRRKVETEDGFEQKPGFGSGGSGMMGEYIKEKREENSKRLANTQVEMVDLTSGSRSSLFERRESLTLNFYR